jgi:predicted dehydrogenase
MSINNHIIYNAAIIGLGNIAWRFDQSRVGSSEVPYTHAGALAVNPKTSIIAGVSIDAKDRLEFAERYGVQTYSTIEALFDVVTPDIVSICSPSDFHFEHAMYCLEHRVPMIWLEKPPAKTTSELDMLIKAQKNYDASTILINYSRRYSNIYRQLKKICDSNIYGNAVMMHISYSRGLEINGSHMIDAAFYVADDPEKAFLDKVMDFPARENPSFSFKFSHGLPAIVTGMDLSYQCAEITVTFERGRATVLYAGASGRVEVQTEHEHFPGFYILTEINGHSLKPNSQNTYFSIALSDLMDAYESGRHPVSSLHTARKSQELWNAVREK